MEITEVRVSLRDNPQSRLKAYATLTFDHCFVVRNVKIIEGKNGVFVAMPSRKPRVSCSQCHFKVDAGTRFCHQCGAALSRQGSRDQPPGAREVESSEAHRDIAHPITVEFRQRLQKAVLDAYEAEKTKEATLSPPASGEVEFNAA